MSSAFVKNHFNTHLIAIQPRAEHIINAIDGMNHPH